MRKVLVLGVAFAALVAAGPATAAEILATMLNRGAEGAMVFEPPLIAVQPEDTGKAKQVFANLSDRAAPALAAAK